MKNVKHGFLLKNSKTGDLRGRPIYYTSEEGPLWPYSTMGWAEKSLRSGEEIVRAVVTVEERPLELEEVE